MNRLNLDMLNELKMLMEEDFQLLIDTYCEDGALKLEGLKEAVFANNAKEVSDFSHSLKGSSANVGAEILADLCYQMEAKGKKEDLSGAEALYAEIVTEFKCVDNDIQQV
jgi:histidine phosphotransfer protein HptB